MYNLPPLPGDILPAKLAIEMIAQTDLEPPIEVPAIPGESEPDGLSEFETEWLIEQINIWKKLRHALILSHNYQIPEIQDVSDYVGDSVYLAKMGSESDADIIVEAAVLFMPQILAVMKKRPDQVILAPSLKALCSLAAHANPEKILAWKIEHPGGIVISYVNTYIEVKALSDYCCGSANAAKVIEHAAKEHHNAPMLFLPDVNLGFFAAKTLQDIGYPIDNLYLVMGACHVHHHIQPSDVENALKEHPKAAIAVHPECGCTSSCMRLVETKQMLINSVGFRSTSGMFKYAETVPQKEIIVATETGNIYPLSKAVPDKTFIPANPKAVCEYMKQNTLRSIYESLVYLKHEITVDPELAAKARIPIERMLRIT
jgi:quinolinate synthase